MSASGVDDDALRNSVQVTGEVMVIIIIVIFFVVVLILFLNLYAKLFWWRIDLQQPRDPNSSARRFLFASGQDPAAALRAGLDPAILKKIPVVGFSISQQEFKDGLECAVCLCELEDGEKARLLPICNHGFHVECIDMWFQSHSTCPLCRNPVNVVEEGESTVEIDTQSSPGSSESSPNFPTNVLFWRDGTQVSSASASAAACLEEGVSSPSSSSSSTETSRGSSRSGGPEILVIEIPSSSTSEHLSSSVSPEFIFLILESFTRS